MAAEYPAGPEPMINTFECLISIKNLFSLDNVQEGPRSVAVKVSFLAYFNQYFNL